MKTRTLWILLMLHSWLAFATAAATGRGPYTERELQADDFLDRISEELRMLRRNEALQAYAYSTNITNENQRRMMQVYADGIKVYKAKAEDILRQGYTDIDDETIKRKVKWLTDLDFRVLSDDEYRELVSAIISMQSNYAKVKVCAYDNPKRCDLSLEPGIETRIENSRDPEELKYYWTQWYDRAGKPVRDHFLKFLEIGHKAAKLNGYANMAESWIDEYEDPNFEKTLERIYEEVLPLYKHLHAFVRYRLRQTYGELVPETGNIPMHLLGNLWGQTWDNIMDIVTPYPNKDFVNVTGEMIKQGYTPTKMFQLGDEFFQSLGMLKLPEIFWKESLLEKPSDGRDVVCHASAWDMYTKDDVRIKQCTKVTMEQLYVVHHELGHIQYYLQYQHQPLPFRRSPNPGFHEAVGDVLALSAETPKHLEKIGLLKNFNWDEESRINSLFRYALRKIAFLPFSYSLDKYRWAVFRGEIEEADLNCEFWRMRSNFTGIEPPVARSPVDFDPPAKFHVSGNVEYLRYFAAHIFEFQFLRAACLKAEQYSPGNPELTFDNCDIYGSREAGDAFKAMLQLGSSKPWPDALELFTGEREMSASALLEYFEPLRKWLENENRKLNIPIGWTQGGNCK